MLIVLPSDGVNPWDAAGLEARLRRSAARNIDVIDAPAPSPGDAYRDAPPRRGFTVIVKWFRPIVIPLLLFSIGMEVAFASGTDPFRLVPGWFRIASIVTFPLIAYACMCRLVNRTTITGEDERLSVRHGPLPWPGRKDVAVRDVADLFVKTVIHTSRHGNTLTYEVHVKIADGRTAELVDGLTAKAQADFIVEALRERLAR